MTWIQTASGQAVDLLDPKIETIDLADIAHALSRICRFTGHAKTHYSVAQHSVLVAEQLPESMQLYGLLHDAHEAYLGDISSPMKRALGTEAKRQLAEMADKFDTLIHLAAGLGNPLNFVKLAIKAADIQLLMTERRDLMRAPPQPWGDFESVMPLNETIEPWSAADAEAKFLDLFERLQRLRHTRHTRHVRQTFRTR